MGDSILSSQEALSEPERFPSAPPLHRKYLRATHCYRPNQTAISALSGQVSITAPLRQGDIVLVHLTHPNGWADATLLSTGTRGWIPTNYCQVYDPRPVRSLFHALTCLWDYLSLTVNEAGFIEDRQDYVQGIIAGVRRLLEHCDCLHRDDALVQRHIGLRRTRKSLLADLSTLIKCRDDVHNTFADPDDVLWSTVDLCLTNAFKVARRAVRFLDLWTQFTSPRRLSVEPQDIELPESPQKRRPSPLPPSPPQQLGSIDECQPYVSPVYSLDEKPKSTFRVVESDSTTQNDGPQGLESSVGPASPERHQSFLYSPSIASMPSPMAMQSGPISGNVTASDCAVVDIASERLTAAHEQFLGDIGAFIGLHLQSRTSMDLAATTQRSLEAAEDLLLVVTKISEQNPGQSQGIIAAVVSMRKNLARLTETADRLCTTPITQEDPELIEIVEPEDGRGLVAAATGCVRAAGDCTAKTRRLLDHATGDFFLAPTVGTLQDPPNSDLSKVTPRVEAVSEESWSEAVPGAANSQDYESADVRARSQPDRPSCLSHSTTDDTNNCTPSSAAPSENMRRPGSSSPPPIILCDSPTSTEFPSTLSQPKQTIESVESPQQLSIKSWTPPVRKQSLGMSVTETSSAYQDSLRNSVSSANSPTSTRATTPDKHQQLPSRTNPTLCSFGSVLSVTTTGTVLTDDCSDHEADVLVRSHAHELLFNKEGQIVGGTLAALIEKLTSQFAPPDSTCNTTFFLTFRLFTNAEELAQTLIDRYQYVGESHVDCSPARLRVYNFFKTWLESHYSTESDASALETIHSFATETLIKQFLGPGKRLADLTKRASQRNITSAETQLVSAIGKTSVSLATDYERTSIPPANINKEQLHMLTGGSSSKTRSLMGLDPVEIARQLTIVESKIFCAIQPMELLGLEWTKKINKSVNVRAMSRFSTDLTHLVADSILSIEQVKKRASVLKHWIKIAQICLEMENYSSLMAIACSLTSSTIVRLRRTWELLSAKSRASFEEIKSIVDVSRNYAALRQRLQTPKAPCLPFVGMYLTDLTFIDAGNHNTRILPNIDDDEAEPVTVINFDKHIRSARVVGHLQRYQVPYRLQHVREIQDWLEAQLTRVRESDDCTVQSLWRRSQKLEPKILCEDEKRQASVVEKEKEKASGRLKPKNKPSVSGLNAFMAKSKNDFMARVKTSGPNRLATDTEAGPK